MFYNLLCLNTYGGFLYEELTEFLKNQGQRTDFILLQEVFHSTHPEVLKGGYRANLFSEIAHLLPDHLGIFAPKTTGFINLENKVNYPLGYGIALFYRNDFQLSLYKNFFDQAKDFDNSTFGVPKAQICAFNLSGQIINICNIHGRWIPADPGLSNKDDTEERVYDMLLLRNYLQSLKDPTIVCGDFNLNPDTKSLAVFKDSFRDLIDEYNVQSTRTHYYKKEGKQADYAFISKEVGLNSFQVLESPVVSDHKPIVLSFML